MPNLNWDTGRKADKVERQGGFVFIGHHMKIDLDQLSLERTIDVLAELNRRLRLRELDQTAAHQQGYEAALREAIENIQDMDYKHNAQREQSGE
jgi:hypothetical protein